MIGGLDPIEPARSTPKTPSKPIDDPRVAAIRRLFAIQDALAAGGCSRAEAGRGAKPPRQAR